MRESVSLKERFHEREREYACEKIERERELRNRKRGRDNELSVTWKKDRISAWVNEVAE